MKKQASHNDYLSRDDKRQNDLFLLLEVLALPLNILVGLGYNVDGSDSQGVDG